jgi:hypothetical protein
MPVNAGLIRIQTPQWLNIAQASARPGLKSIFPSWNDEANKNHYPIVRDKQHPITSTLRRCRPEIPGLSNDLGTLFHLDVAQNPPMFEFGAQAARRTRNNLATTSDFNWTGSRRCARRAGVARDLPKLRPNSMILVQRKILRFDPEKPTLWRNHFSRESTLRWRHQPRGRCG